MSSLVAFVVSLHAGLLRLIASRRMPKSRPTERVRILCLTAGGIDEMIDTLPLLYTLRRHYPRAPIAVACEEAAAPIAMACPVVKIVSIYRRSFLPWLATLKSAARLQGFDWVIVATPFYNGRLARLSRLCNAKVRIGISKNSRKPSPYLSDSVAPANAAERGHRIEAVLSLLKPLGLVRVTNWGSGMKLRLPASIRNFTDEALAEPPFSLGQRYLLIHFSAVYRLLREEDLIVLLRQLLITTSSAIALLSDMANQQTSREIAMVLGSPRVATLETMGPLELAGLLEKAELLLTGGDMPAHLAAAMDTPAVVLWSQKRFGETQSRSERHVFLQLAPGQTTFAVAEVWQAMQPFLVIEKSDVEEQWQDLLQLPGDSDSSP